MSSSQRFQRSFLSDLTAPDVPPYSAIVPTITPDPTAKIASGESITDATQPSHFPTVAGTKLVTVPVSDVIENADGSIFSVAQTNGVITSYDAATASVIRTYQVGSFLAGIDISPDGTFLLAVEDSNASGAVPGIVHRLDLASGVVTDYSMAFAVAVDGPFHDVAIFDNGIALLTSKTRGSTTAASTGGSYTFNTATGAFARFASSPFAGIVMDSADRHHVALTQGGPNPFNPNSSLTSNVVYALSNGGGIRQEARNFPFFGNTSLAAYSGDARLLALVEPTSNGIKIYDSQHPGAFGDLNLIAAVPGIFGTNVRGIAFDETGDFLYVITADPNGLDTPFLQKISAATGQVVDGIVPQGVTASADPYRSGETLTVGEDSAYFLYNSGTALYRIANPLATTPTDAPAGGGVVDGTASADLIHGSAAGDTLRGGGGSDILRGYAGNDVLDGGSGHDVMYGGAGDDTYFVDDAADLAIENDNGPGSGNDLVIASVSHTLAPSIERLTLTGTGNLNGTGNSLANIITGTVGDNVIDGQSGADTMTGYAGNDTYWVDDAGDQVIEQAGEGTDTVRATLAAYTLAANVENLTYSGPSTATFSGTGNELDNVITGSDGDDTLTGLGGNDTLIGGTGNNLLRGGTGDDLFILTAAATIEEVAGEGIDTVQLQYTPTGTGGYTLPANVERLIGSGKLIGNALDNLIQGSASGDSLDGGAGADTMVGGDGNDTYYVDNTNDLVIETATGGNDTVVTSIAGYAKPANVENYTYTGSQSITLVGTAGDEVYTGGSGNDFFDMHQGGRDTAIGGLGDDGFYVGANAIFESIDGGAGGFDQLALQGNYSTLTILGPSTYRNIELIVLLSGSDSRFGDASNSLYNYNLFLNQVTLNRGDHLTVSANELLAGENSFFNASKETNGFLVYYGGLGNDGVTGTQQSDGFYFGEGHWAASDIVDGQGGTLDQLVLQGHYSGTSAVTFGANQIISIEQLVLLSGTTTQFGGGGAAFSYDITMNDANIAAGQSFSVSANGLQANEALAYNASAETNAAISVFSGAGNDTLILGALGDRVFAGAGNDAIVGNGGADQLTGGSGGDTFIYLATSDSTPAARDQILDFTSDDRIDVGTIRSFSFIGANAFTAAGQLRVTNIGGSVYLVEGETNGDGQADLSILVTSDHALSAADFNGVTAASPDVLHLPVAPADVTAQAAGTIAPGLFVADVSPVDAAALAAAHNLFAHDPIVPAPILA